MSAGAHGRAAVFLDRDGTICREVDFLARPEDLELLPGAARAIATLNASAFPVVVVTNQSGIARGLFDEEMLGRIHARLARLLGEAGAHVDAVHFCPHHPDFGGECSCRKPRPGMLEAAAREMELDLCSSWIVGDSLRDLEAGRAVGARGILVATGKGADAWEAMSEEERERTEYCDDLSRAVERILAR